MKTNLPASNDSEIHRRLNLLSTTLLELFALIADYGTEPLDSGGIDRNLRPNESFANVDLGKDLVIAVPQPPVELFDSGVPSFGDLVDGGEALLGAVDEGEHKRNGGVGAIFEKNNRDGLGRRIERDFHRLEVGFVISE
jgi:hypothetical protein